jgi:glycosyltransferase involved in cell wall biosynthesis
MKKKVLFHSNFCRAFTGFGKNKKNILRYLYDTGKYELIELANGKQWNDPQCNAMPWKCVGAMPNPASIQGMDDSQKRAEGYGLSAVDRAVKEFKPDVYIGMEDIWAFRDYHKKPWWNKINTMVWTTLDSLPILPQAIEYASKTKNYFVWASFAEKAMNEMGYDNVKTLRGSLDHKNFFRLSDEDRSKLRSFHNLKDEFIIGFVFRNQLRKSVPNILDGFKLFKDANPDSKPKLFLHTHWSEGWNIGNLIKEKGIDPSDILTTYVCKNCGTYHIANFRGQEQDCNTCGGKGSVNTTNTGKGVTEQQLNEIYNLMDVYCHPFTSGGQEIPIQEAKLTELVTLVTNYSCGEDNCTEESGGLPLEWNEYREPGTQFIKASTCPKSILKQLQKTYDMSLSDKEVLGKRARQWAIDHFSIDVIGKQLEDILDNMPEVDYNYDSEYRKMNPDYVPEDGMNADKFLIDIHKNILDEDIDSNSMSFKHWVAKLKAGEKAVDILNHFKKIAFNYNKEQSKPSLDNLLGEEDRDNRIAIVIPDSETDVLLINSLLQEFKETYKDYNIYVFTKPENYQYIEDSPYLFKILPYTPQLENSLYMEGVSENNGLFEMVFHPNATTQKSLCFTHNGKDETQFSFV